MKCFLQASTPNVFIAVERRRTLRFPALFRQSLSGVRKRHRVRVWSRHWNRWWSRKRHHVRVVWSRCWNRHCVGWRLRSGVCVSLVTGDIDVSHVDSDCCVLPRYTSPATFVVVSNIYFCLEILPILKGSIELLSTHLHRHRATITPNTIPATPSPTPILIHITVLPLRNRQQFSWHKHTIFEKTKIAPWSSRWFEGQNTKWLKQTKRPKDITIKTHRDRHAVWKNQIQII